MLIAIPIAAVLLAIGLVIAAVVALLATGHSIRMKWRRASEQRDGRENVRVIRQPPPGDGRSTG